MADELMHVISLLKLYIRKHIVLKLNSESIFLIQNIITFIIKLSNHKIKH